VDSDSLVPRLDPFKDCRMRLVVRAEALVVDELLLQGRLEPFHHGVVVAVAGAAHALPYAMLLKKSSTDMTGTLYTAIAAMHQANQWRPALHGHRECIYCNRRIQRVRHAPPHNTSALCVHHACEVKEAFVSWYVGDLAQPLLVGPVCVEVTREKIARRRMRTPRCCWTIILNIFRTDSAFLQDSRDRGGMNGETKFRKLARVRVCEGHRPLRGSTDPGIAPDRWQTLETNGRKLGSWTRNTLLLAGATLPTGGIRDSSGNLDTVFEP
jgi:hypothetical protein